MTKTTYAKEFERAILVDDKFLRRVGDLIVNHEGHVTCKVWLSDAATISGLSLDELIAFPNTNSRRIVRIDVATDYADPLRTDLSLRGDSVYADPVRYEVVGSDKDATYVSSELDKLLGGVFQWYSPLAVVQGFHFALGGALFTLGVGALGAAVSMHSALWSVVGFLICGVVFGYSGMVRWLMLRAIFAIGDGVERAARVKARRWQIASIVLIVLALGIIVNLVSNVVFDKFFKS